MIRRFLALLLSFAVALPIGLALGRRESATSPPLATSVAPAAPDGRIHPKKESPGLHDLLREYEAVERARDESEVDPIDELLAGWTEAELQAALSEALTSPEFLAKAGAKRRLVWRLIGAWIKRNPDAAVAWIDTLQSAAIREEMVNEACRHWPADRPMEGIEFLLAHHWEPGESYSSKLLSQALEFQAKEGAGELIRLLDRLAGAKVDIHVGSLDFPIDFDYAKLVGSEEFRAHHRALFQDIVFAEWRDTQPRRMLDWMVEAGEWERFNGFLDPERPADFPHAARFWDGADPGQRQAVLGMLKWQDLDPEAIRRFIGETKDPEGQDMMIADCLQSFPAKDRVALLECLPSAERRLAILLQLHPHTDWRPEAAASADDPAAARALREAVGRWGVPVPPPLEIPDPFADPFADP